jgi:hypothetical protein
MNPTKVSVTDKHIADGTACDGSHCPIALAVLEALAAQGVKVTAIMVDSFDATVALGAAPVQRRYRAALDSHASAFVQSFDEPEDSDLRHASVIAPFELELTWRELPS